LIKEYFDTRKEEICWDVCRDRFTQISSNLEINQRYYKLEYEWLHLCLQCKRLGYYIDDCLQKANENSG